MFQDWDQCRAHAQKHHGLITVAQATQLGCPPSVFERRVMKGELERVLPGVFRIAGTPETLEHQTLALCIWGGAGAAASHSTGARILRLDGAPDNGIHVVSTTHARRLPPWAHVHHVSRPAVGVREIAGLRVTPPWRILLDMGAEVALQDLRRPFINAISRRLATLPQMNWAVKTYGGYGHPGTSAVRRLILECIELGMVKPPAESELEALLYALVDGSDLPKSLRQYRIWDGKRWRRLDLAFLEFLVAVEVDGWGTHGSWESFQDDRRRDALLSALGWITLRFTWFDLTQRPEEVLALIRQTLALRIKAMGRA